MSDELVHLQVDAGVATITLDSPDNRNALSAQLRRELGAHLATALADDAVRVLVLAHTGRVFCAGMDLKEARGGSAGEQGVNEFPALLETLWNSPKPVVAQVAGPARAGGVGLVAACDVAVASTAATFAFTEVRIGVVPAVISVPVLPRVSPRAAHELMLTGEVFDAQRAVEIGLVNRAVAPEQLEDEVRRYAQMLALGAPGALAATKALLTTDIGEALRARQAESAVHFASDEGQEGIRAFAEKRPPSWVPA
ncbi:MAG: echA21 [Frankiales bacterium]|nr:echA21 [Frankiales bacterium]